MGLGLAFTFLGLTAAKYLAGMYKNLYSNYTWTSLVNSIMKDIYIFLLMIAVSDVAPVDNIVENKAYVIARTVPIVLVAHAFFEFAFALGFSVRQVERDTV